jgi:intraflagellar transport protein 56
MCYFHLDYYDVSLELLAVYLQSKPSSFFSINLKACNHYKLYSGEEAEEEFQRFARTFSEHPMNKEFRSLTLDQDPTGSQAVYQHNRVLFRQSSNIHHTKAVDETPSPLTILQKVSDVLPEAKLNLVIYYLHHEEYQKAFELMEKIVENKEENQYTTTQLILKAILHGVIGERAGSKEHIFLAEKFFHAVGASPTECDTIPGRQSMASYFLLRKEYEEAIVYLRSIAPYLNTNHAFNWNFGLALAASGKKENQLEAEEILLNRINQQNVKSSLIYTSWLARCILRNYHHGSNSNSNSNSNNSSSGSSSSTSTSTNTQKHGAFVWDLYLKMENSQEAYEFLKLIANDFYRMEMFYYATKAFDVLEKINPDPEYWEAKRGACIGFFHQLATQIQNHTKTTSDCSSLLVDHEQHAEEMLKLLQNSNKNHEQAQEIAQILKKWYTTHLKPLINNNM